MPDGLVLDEKGDGCVLLVPQLLPQLLRPLQPPVRQTLIHCMCILQHLSPLFYDLTHSYFYPGLLVLQGKSSAAPNQNSHTKS
jgi:hypothetical protein